MFLFFFLDCGIYIVVIVEYIKISKV